ESGGVAPGGGGGNAEPGGNLREGEPAAVGEQAENVAVAFGGQHGGQCFPGRGIVRTGTGKTLKSRLIAQSPPEFTSGRATAPVRPATRRRRAGRPPPKVARAQSMAASYS